MRSFLNIFWLGLKEIASLLSDLVMVLFVVYAFTMAIYVQATGTSTRSTTPRSPLWTRTARPCPRN